MSPPADKMFSSLLQVAMSHSEVVLSIMISWKWTIFLTKSSFSYLTHLLNYLLWITFCSVHNEKYDSLISSHQLINMSWTHIHLEDTFYMCSVDQHLQDWHVVALQQIQKSQGGQSKLWMCAQVIHAHHVMTTLMSHWTYPCALWTV